MRDEAWRVAILYGHRELGMSFQEIADELSISRQCAHQYTIGAEPLEKRFCDCGSEIKKRGKELCHKCIQEEKTTRLCIKCEIHRCYRRDHEVCSLCRKKGHIDEAFNN
jgi:hypothetical protein